jgi:hypothetical protein
MNRHSQHTQTTADRITIRPLRQGGYELYTMRRGQFFSRVYYFMPKQDALKDFRAYVSAELQEVH